MRVKPEQEHKEREGVQGNRLGSNLTVTTVRYAPPSQRWFSLKPSRIFDVEWGTAPHPIGWTTMNDITAMYIVMCLYNKCACMALQVKTVFGLWLSWAQLTWGVMLKHNDQSRDVKPGEQQKTEHEQYSRSNYSFSTNVSIKEGKLFVLQVYSNDGWLYSLYTGRTSGQTVQMCV